MARYKLTEAAYCKKTPSAFIEEVLQPGTEIETRDDVIPGPHMEPLDEPARTAMAKFLKDGAPLDRAKVSAINLGLTLPGGAVLPAAGEPLAEAATARLMQQLMEQQLATNKALEATLRKLAA